MVFPGKELLSHPEALAQNHQLGSPSMPWSGPQGLCLGSSTYPVKKKKNQQPQTTTEEPEHMPSIDSS